MKSIFTFFLGGILIFSLLAVSTPHASAQSTTLTFVTLGDYGVNNEYEAAVAAMVSGWNPDLILGLGDSYYAEAAGLSSEKYDFSTGRYYCSFLKDVTTTGTFCPVGQASINRFFPALGDHDYDDGGTTNNLPTTYTDYFNLPGNGYTSSSNNERYYDFVSGPVHFFILNSMDAAGSEPDGTDRNSVQAQWLQTQLAASTSSWNVVVMPSPPYSSGTKHGSTIRVQWPFAQWGADVVFSGDEHNYERISRDGIVYFVNGLGGQWPYPFGTPIEGSAARYNATNGAQRVIVTDTSMTFEFYSVNGTLQDTYTITTPHNTATPTFTTTATFTATPTLVLNSTGWQNPSGQAKAISNAGDNNGYEGNPTGAYTDGGGAAADTDSGSSPSTACTDTSADKHRFYNYNLSLPAGAIVQGIQVRLDSSVDSANGNPKSCVSLSWDAGANNWTAWKSTPILSSAETTYLLGSSTDTWGRAWTETEMSSSNFQVRISDITSDNMRDFSLDWVAVNVTYSLTSSSTPTGTWTPMPTATSTFTASPTATNTSTITSTFTASPTLTPTSTNTSTATLPSSSSALISLTFDDGNPSVYNTAFPILSAQGLPATFFFITSWLTDPWKTQLRDLENHGWEIGSHSVDHLKLTDLTLDQVDYQLSQSKLDLEAAGLTVTGFAFPYGAGGHDSTILQHVSQFYPYARSVYPGYNSSPLQRYALYAQVQDSSVSLDTMKSWVDEAILTNRWLIIDMHQIDNTGGLYSITPEDLSAFAAYVKARVDTNMIRAVTVRDGFTLSGGSLATPTATSTNTPSLTPSSTPTSTATSVPTDTATATPSATFTSTNTATPTATLTSSPTATNTASSTPAATKTSTPTSTATKTSTPTATKTATQTASSTPTQTATPTASRTPTATQTGSLSQIKVSIGGANQGSYLLGKSQSQEVSYSGIDNGPVQIVSNNGQIVASERVAYSPDGGASWTSYSELMGMPVNQLTTSYTFPWYNNADLNTQIRFGNVGTSSTTVTVTIGGQIKGTYPLLPNQSTRVSYNGLNAGPVKVTSSGNVPIIASERVAYFNGSAWTSFSEIMGLPSGQLTTSYLFPWYNNVDTNSQLRFGNVGNASTTVTVMVGGVNYGSYTLAPNASQRVSYNGLNAGPVKVTSSGGVPIIASMRVAYTADNGATWPEFSEMMGMPIASLSTSYSFPVYNNLDLNTQIRFGNVSNAATTVTVTIGGVVQGTYSLAPNASQRVSYPLNAGPVVIQSSGNIPIIASMRVAYFDNAIGKWTSFAEMMGLPKEQLTTSYLFPWYNNVNLNTPLRFGVP